jgi:prepilin-type N-terminal cleavage/methylation domain-containing protein
MNANRNCSVASRACGKAIGSEPSRAGRSCGAFTLLELLLVLALLALGACLLAPGLAHTQPDVRAAQCMSNKRQMALACAMYSHDWNDYLVPLAPAGSGASIGWCLASEDWGVAPANTNSDCYTTNCLGRYLAGQVKAYKCPFDTLPSDNGPRIRSISMNCMMVGAYPGINGSSFNSGWRVYRKMTDLTHPVPAMAWVFCDESMCSLVDGFLQLNLTAPQYPDVPAAYHGGNGNCFSFADGHVEHKKWLYRTGDPNAGIINAPYIRHVTSGFRTTSGLDADWVWLKNRSSAPK